MVDVPSQKDLMRPTIDALKALGGSGHIREIFSEILKQQDYSQEVIDEPSSDGRRTKLEYRSHWARTLLKHAASIENVSTGVWALTPGGYTLNDKQIQARIDEFNQHKRQSRPIGLSDDEAASEGPLDEINDTENEWKNSLLDALKALTPKAFEQLSQMLLRVSGFIDVNITGKPGDGGIDGTGILRMNLVSFRVLFQCKRYDGSVSANTVRDFRGAMQGRADRGLIITTGTFTPAAKAEATRDGAPLIDLINGDELCELLKDNKFGVKTEMVEKVTVNDEWFEKNF